MDPAVRRILAAIALFLVGWACSTVTIETADDCREAGYVLRPATGGRAQCESGEVEVAYVAFGLEGAACCRRETPSVGGY